VFVSVIRSRREGTLIRINNRVQRPILRPLPAEFGGVAFASHYQSATKQTLVGGDLYDVAMTQSGPRLLIGDVKGKGLEAVDRCAAVLSVFREMAVSLLLKHAGGRLADDVLLVLGELSVTQQRRHRGPFPQPDGVALAGGQEKL
jgi:hypothetical protein